MPCASAYIARPGPGIAAGVVRTSAAVADGTSRNQPTPTAALGPAETGQVRNLVRQLKSEGIGIFLISHDIHDVFDLSDRISVMYHGQIVGTVEKGSVTPDEVLGMIIMGKQPGDVTEADKAAIELRG